MPGGTSGRPPDGAGYCSRSPWPQGSMASVTSPCSARSRQTPWNSATRLAVPWWPQTKTTPGRFPPPAAAGTSSWYSSPATGTPGSES